MKKLIALFLFAAILLSAALAGCGPAPQESSQSSPLAAEAAAQKGAKKAAEKAGKAPPDEELPTLRILVDLIQGGDTYSECGEIRRFVQDHAEGCGETYRVEVEALPPLEDPAARNPAITGLHMELLGGGPDLFILRNFTDSFGYFTDVKNFFPFPTSAMRQRLFLPLDDYIADDPEWAHLRPAVMEAGKLDGSQQLVPLSFSIPLALVEKDVYTPDWDPPIDCWQMLDHSDPVLRWAASFGGTEMLGVLADYSKEEPSFTEEELLRLVRKVREARKDTEDLVLDRETYGLRAPSITASPLNDSFFRNDPDDNFWMLPPCNRDGGVTARVNTFAAISRSTPYPDAAWAVLKCLYSREAQQADIGMALRMPVYEGLGKEGAPLLDGTQGGWYLDQWDYDQLEAVQEQITAAEFTTPLSVELDELFHQCLQLEEAEVEGAVHDAYIHIRMMLGES